MALSDPPSTPPFRPLDSVFQHLIDLSPPSPTSLHADAFQSDTMPSSASGIIPISLHASISLTSSPSLLRSPSFSDIIPEFPHSRHASSDSPSYATPHATPSLPSSSRIPHNHHLQSPMKSIPLTRTSPTSKLASIDVSNARLHPASASSSPNRRTTTISTALPRSAGRVSDLDPSQRHSISSITSSASSSTTDLTGLSLVRLNPPHPKSSFDYQDAFSDFARIVPNVPRDEAWLRDVTVRLWIDQEDFRAIQPEFILTRYGQSTSLDNSSVVAEFSPRHRQSYSFHYSSLNALPILRRMTLNGSQCYDHISRQAHLSLKSNGVYMITGEEDKGRLCWRFEYVVEDRRGKNGKPLSGEKNLTPLRFSCSPGMLTPEHGKKIRLFHVVKKQVASKLGAVKLEPSDVIAQRKTSSSREELETGNKSAGPQTNRHRVDAVDDNNDEWEESRVAPPSSNRKHRAFSESDASGHRRPVIRK